MTQPVILNEADFDSPGFEHLRTYQSMSNLYHKLIALNYQRDFCSLYRCPPIHKYYFSFSNKNSGEQQFLFTCLCAWLIKDKCQMNLELEPEEYEDPNVIIGVIIEALKLLLFPDERGTGSKNSINFPPGRLKVGFGPEVIWTMNILADRALELMFEAKPIDRKVKISYINKSNSESSKQLALNNSSITIGQPFVGGGLTTRPLGNYQVDDTDLLFDDDNQSQDESSDKDLFAPIADPEEWYAQVERVSQVLESARLIEESENSSPHTDWRPYLEATVKSRDSVQQFLNNTKSLLELISNRIDRHLKIIGGREKFIQNNLRSRIDEFLEVWREYSQELSRNETLLAQVNTKTDQFESYNERLKQTNEQIGIRINELNDGIELRQLESMTSRLRMESDEFDIKIGLLLTVYAKRQEEFAASTRKLNNP